MPVIKVHGDHLPDGSVGEIKVPSNPASRLELPPIDPDRWFRNGKCPDANAIGAMNALANSVALFRGKCPIATYSNLIKTPSSQLASRVRHRFAWKSGPYTHALLAVVTLYPPNAGLDQDSYAKLTVYSDATETTTVTTQEFHYGASPKGSTAAVGWGYMKTVIQMIDGISPNTEYYGKFSDENYGRIQSVLVFELSSLTENNAGYLVPNVTMKTPLTDSLRGNLASVVNTVWREGGAHVLYWDCANHGSPITRASSTPANVVDTSLTTISASTPGPTLDMTGKARLSQTSGVPCVLKAFGSWAAGGGATSGGGVYLKNSAGTTIGSIVDQWTSTTPRWFSTTLTVPTGVDKYDLQFTRGTSGGTFTLYSVCVYELD